MLDTLNRSLPAATLPLVGRQTELAELDTLLTNPACRLITLVGPGGIGKTRLALELATRHQETFRDGVVLVDLQSVLTPDLLVSAIADALHMPLQGADDLRTQLLAVLHRQDVLLLLDSFEHLRGEVDLLVAILQDAPQVKLLVTSQEVLHLQAEWLYPLEALAVPPSAAADLLSYPAVALFVAHARRVRRDFALEQEAHAVVAICRLVGGLPLALELAAAWTYTLDCATIVEELARNLALLTTNSPDMPERHRSMRAIFDQAWVRLNPDEQTVLRRLAVFRGGFTRDAAAQVAGATLPLLTALVDKSLVGRTGERYWLHDLLRQYAEQHLAALPKVFRQARQAHADYYIERLHSQEEAILSAAQRTVLDGIATEIDNMRVAWQWVVAQADTAAIFRGEHMLAKYYQFRGFYQEGSAMLAQGLACLRAAPTSRESDIALAGTLVDWALLNIRLGRTDEARAAFVESQAVYENYNLPPRPGCSTDPRIGLSELALYAGNYAEAARLAAAAAERNAAHNHAINLLEALHMLVNAYRLQGDYSLAQTYAQQLLNVAQSIQHRYVLAFCFTAIGMLRYALGDDGAARHYLQSAYAFAEEVPNVQIQALSLLLLGKVALRQARYAEAEAWLQQSLALFQDMGDQGNTAEALTGLGQAAGARACPDEARHWFAQALDLTSALDYLPLTMLLITGIASWLLQTDQPEQGPELLGFVLQHPASDPETLRQGRDVLERYREALDPAVFAAAVEHGQTLDRATALARARLALTLPINAGHNVVQMDASADKDIIEPLTSREREVLALIAEGLSNRAIADRLVLSVGTVRWYAQQIYGKLGVGSRTQALARARAQGLLV
jgi:predicted ATPase/DNA-binding CsgD family transcriptional regulator